MAITASDKGSTPRELIPAGMYVARCYQMIHIGTVKEIIMGAEKELNKVRIGWELPTEMKVFKEENGEQPMVISKEYTLSLGDKANLRLMLDSWRGKRFTDDEAKAFDITRLLGVPCLINIIHNQGKKDPTKYYEEIKTITPLMKGQECPPQINPSFEFNYEEKWDWNVFDKFPEFIREKMQKSLQFMALPQREIQVDKSAEYNQSLLGSENEALPF
jgi:hypothetical protein